MSQILPFPRGKTYADSVVIMTDADVNRLEGRVFEVPDTIHGTGMKVKLRVVKNDSAGAITVARRLMKFSTDAKDFGRRVAGYASVRGQICKPLDDMYAEKGVGTIADDDLFYVVEGGPCKVNTGSGSISLAAQAPVCTDASGYIDGTKAHAGFAAFGVLDAASTSTSTATLVYVNEGFGHTGT